MHIMHLIDKYWPIIGAVALYLWTAAVSTMPPKGAKWDGSTFYDWLYDFAHVTLNSRPAISSRPGAPEIGK